MASDKMPLWILFFIPGYSTTPKFGGVFSTWELAAKAAKGKDGVFITHHILDREED